MNLDLSQMLVSQYAQTCGENGFAQHRPISMLYGLNLECSFNLSDIKQLMNPLTTQELQISEWTDACITIT